MATLHYNDRIQSLKGTERPAKAKMFTEWAFIKGLLTLH